MYVGSFANGFHITAEADRTPTRGRGFGTRGLRLREEHIVTDWRTIVNDVRTFFLKEPDFVIPLLPDPKEELPLAA